MHHFAVSPVYYLVCYKLLASYLGSSWWIKPIFVRNVKIVFLGPQIRWPLPLVWIILYCTHWIILTWSVDEQRQGFRINPLSVWRPADCSIQTQIVVAVWQRQSTAVTHTILYSVIYSLAAANILIYFVVYNDCLLLQTKILFTTVICMLNHCLEWNNNNNNDNVYGAVIVAKLLRELPDSYDK